jgi:hypothetical protein
MSQIHQIHQWQETGRVDVSLKHQRWTWLKCAVCGQNGFKRGDLPVVYTWANEHMETAE